MLLVLGRQAGRQAQQFGQIVDAVLLVAVLEGGIFLRQAGRQIIRIDPRHALHRGHRDGERGFADTHQDRLRHRQRERQSQHEHAALALLGLDRERTAELLDLVGDHVHAHAASGQLGDAGGSGKARLGDQRKQLVVGGLDVGTQQPALDAALADRLAIQPAAVVADPDHHLGRLARDPDMHRALGRLAGLAAFSRGLDAVRDRVAQHVLERRLDAVEQVAIHFAVRTIDVQLRALALILRCLTQGATQVGHHRVEWQHACAQQAVLQLGADS